ncbi:hypothetical protein BCR35DRAFT_299890 [Leucosporidium creatinivorum]|uniref:Uncharacterized protein n=1 Tax=Leucosporidium creatinivorum TaxID=106004 RepID=A0A1Y2G2M0_9BASI|nr:hypothetical protein BCR35DRAFT_299890 [Leucosporidium creatinivorum]
MYLEEMVGRYTSLKRHPSEARRSGWRRRRRYCSCCGCSDLFVVRGRDASSSSRCSVLDARAHARARRVMLGARCSMLGASRCGVGIEYGVLFVSWRRRLGAALAVDGAVAVAEDSSESSALAVNLVLGNLGVLMDLLDLEDGRRCPPTASLKSQASENCTKRARAAAVEQSAAQGLP